MADAESLDIYILNMIFIVDLFCVNCNMFELVTVSVIPTSNYVVKLSKWLVTDAQPKCSVLV